MVNIDFVDIDNAKMVGRLLPFWARGKRMSLIIQALLSPICSVHAAFKAWALERYIENHITAQKMSLEWFLKYRLKDHFVNADDSFSVVHGVNESVSCFSFGKWFENLHWDDDLRWSDEPDSSVSEEYSDGSIESIGMTNVYAPAITETLGYGKEDYERDIRNIMSKYMVNFNKVNIIIKQTETSNTE